MIPPKRIIGYGAFVLNEESGKINDHESASHQDSGFITRDNFKKKSDAIEWAREQVGDIHDSVLIYGIDERGNIICDAPHGQLMDGEDFLSFA